MGFLRRLRALLGRVWGWLEPADAQDAADDTFAGHRRLLELADAARTSAAQLVAARARLDRERQGLRPGDERDELDRQLAELREQQEAAEAKARELAGEAAGMRRTAERMAADRTSATSKAAAAELARRHAQLVRAARDAVREAEDETLRLVARGRALDELRALETGDDLREVRGPEADRRARGH